MKKLKPNVRIFTAKRRINENADLPKSFRIKLEPGKVTCYHAGSSGAPWKSSYKTIEDLMKNYIGLKELTGFVTQPGQMLDVPRCARCVREHHLLRCRTLKQPLGDFRHWAVCPTVNDVILLNIVNDKVIASSSEHVEHQGEGDPRKAPSKEVEKAKEELIEKFFQCAGSEHMREVKAVKKLRVALEKSCKTLMKIADALESSIVRARPCRMKKGKMVYYPPSREKH